MRMQSSSVLKFKDNRRFYKRYKEELTTLVYAQGIEDTVKSNDISENGFSFYTDKDHYKKGEILNIQFINSQFPHLNEVISFKCVIKHIEDGEETKIGCEVIKNDILTTFIQMLEARRITNLMHDA